MTADDEARLYEATRRLSGWLFTLLDCEWITQEARASLCLWLGSIPQDWWLRFPADDARERERCESAN